MKLIDADEVLKHIDAYWGTCQRIRKPRNGETAVMLDIKAIIEAWHAVDAVPVIRCKDCKHYKWEIDMCNLPGATVFPMNVVHEDDYCSRAERKEENGK